MYWLLGELLCSNNTEFLEPGWKNSTTLPNFTICAQNVYLATLPTLFLALVCSFLIYHLRRTPNVTSPAVFRSPIHFQVIFGYAIVAILTLMLFYDLYDFFANKSSDFVVCYADIVRLAGTSFALVLTSSCKNKRVTSSGVLTLYWLVCIVCGTSELAYSLRGFFSEKHPVDVIRMCLYSIVYVLFLIELTLCCWTDESMHGIGKISPETTSSFANQLTYQWFSKLITLGTKKSLKMEDLWELDVENKSENLAPLYWAKLHESIKKYRSNVETNPGQSLPSIYLPIFSIHKIRIISGLLHKISADLLQLVTPYLLGEFIQFIMDKNQPTWRGIAIIILMFLVSTVQMILMQKYFHDMFKLGMNIRVSLASAVYRKSLMLSNEARKKNSIGEITNLISGHVVSIQNSPHMFFLSFSLLWQILLAGGFLLHTLGWALLPGLIFIPVTIFQIYMTRQLKHYNEKLAKLKDERIKLMTEGLNGVKMLKLYGWEPSLKKRSEKIREEELRLTRRTRLLNNFMEFMMFCTPSLVSALSFIVYVSLDPIKNILTPNVVFVALSYFATIQTVFSCLPYRITEWTKTHTSRNRLNNFFGADEIESIDCDSNDSAINNDNNNEKEDKESAIRIKNGSFSWSSDENPTLRDICLDIKRGELVAIVGKVGSGKSSLLNAFLSEMHKISGTVQLNGSVAYVPQLAWIQNMTLKDNILFNKPLDAEVYEKVIRNCALTIDLANLPGGDSTEIGENGINLSGGQKQRVSLARAVYHNPDIILLDDPLSAVDSHVGKHIFDNVISSSTGCLRNKTRVLVTHGLSYLRYCDKVIVIENGCIREMGAFNELMSNDGAFARFLEEYLMEEKEEEDVKEEVNPVIRSRINSQQSSQIVQKSNENVSCETETDTLLGQNTAQLIEEEVLQCGKVNRKVYFAYFQAINTSIVISFLIASVASTVLGVYSKFYLAELSDQASNSTSNGTDVRLYLINYTFLGIGQSSIVCAASIILSYGMVQASRNLHSHLLANILNSPMSFFDTTPIGRIISRFGSDIESVDSKLPDAISEFVKLTFTVLATVSVNIIVTPWAAAAVVGIACVYYWVLTKYIKTSRQLKRLTSSMNAPIVSHVQESIHGTTSIRAYGMTEDFIQQFESRLETHLMVSYPSIVSGRWLTVRTEFLSSLIVLVVAGLVVYFRDSDSLTAGLVGLSVSYALSTPQHLCYAVRHASDLETNIVAVERITEYTVTPTEGINSTTNPPSDWPTNGKIIFKNFCLKYREGLELVLNNLDFTIDAKEKVGIVGRTGAGKSSLTLALFRIIEADEGCIEIDGLDIAKIKLEHLRSRLTIVPQDPVLFSGSLRMNLDPFDSFGDEKIWNALENAHLSSFVSALPGQLHYTISEGGSNLSVGQRQLLCLARALLRKTKILILDEAAAAVDLETDSLIQETIREQFKDCTVLTIAHRLNTVMDSDRLLVLYKGKMVEFDTPGNLLSNSDGVFYSMARDAKII